MSLTTESDRLLIEQVREGDEVAWRELIDRFEGRLLAFVEARVGHRTAGEDVVQETFIGLLNSLPNFDASRPLESYLFSIAAHKLTDHLRRSGRRPALPLGTGSGSDEWDVPDAGRGASTIFRSGERKQHEEVGLVQALREQIGRIQQKGDWVKLKCLELLFVRGQSNKQIAAELGITEQDVANYKFDFVERLRVLLRKQDLPSELFS
jgi:RNA polymerase sigma-70 factor (ECF subfamily)